jgi:hypothetical protein
VPDKPQIDVAQIVKESLGGLSSLLPAAEKNPAGGRFLLSLLGLTGGIWLTSLWIQQASLVKKIERSPLLQDRPGSELIREIEQKADGTKTFETIN